MTTSPRHAVTRRAPANSSATARWCAAGSMSCSWCCLRLSLVGGATRLTDSGLSITEWKPIHGVIPPLDEAEWQEEFEKYQQIPEYQQINKGMSLDEFKRIFWWEWAHRAAGAAASASSSRCRWSSSGRPGASSAG